MAKEFDIYLRNRLVECDLLVYSIPYRDGISAANRLILEAALKGYLIHMAVATQMGLEVVPHIDKMIKLCLEKLNMGVGIGAFADFKFHSTLAAETSPIVVNTPDVITLERIFSDFENGLAVAVQPLATQASFSTGRGKFSLPVDSNVAGTLKHGLLSLRSTAAPEATIGQLNQVNHIDIDSPIVTNTTLQSLCYQLTFDVSASVEIAALVLGTEIRHSLGRWYSGTVPDSRVTGTKAQKFIVAQSIVGLLQEAEAKLMKVLYPEESSVSVCVLDLEIEKKRCRMLYEMDTDTLATYDDMSLDDVDYVIL